MAMAAVQERPRLRLFARVHEIGSAPVLFRRSRPASWYLPGDRPAIAPGEDIHDETCGGRHRLEASPGGSGVLLYRCAGQGYVGGLAGLVVNGLRPTGQRRAAAAADCHPHVCGLCGRVRECADCAKPKVFPRRCRPCNERLKALVAQFAHVQPAAED